VALETRGGDAGKQTHLLTRDRPTRLPAIYRRIDFLLIAIVWPGPLGVTCGKPPSEYMFSELQQIADIVAPTDSLKMPKTHFLFKGMKEMLIRAPAWCRSMGCQKDRYQAIALH
jgi:hypothetical protein